MRDLTLSDILEQFYLLGIVSMAQWFPNLFDRWLALLGYWLQSYLLHRPVGFRKDSTAPLTHRRVTAHSFGIATLSVCLLMSTLAAAVNPLDAAEEPGACSRPHSQLQQGTNPICWTLSCLKHGKNTAKASRDLGTFLSFRKACLPSLIFSRWKISWLSSKEGASSGTVSKHRILHLCKLYATFVS